MRQIRGSCLCGACTFSATPQTREAGICHCEMCNKWSGGMFVNVACGDSVVFDAGAPVAAYRASAWGERVFCKICGASLVWQTQDGSHQNVSVHAFDGAVDFALGSQIFIDSKPDGYALAGASRVMTGAEVMALVAAGGDD